jgi:hypothetical protein
MKILIPRRLGILPIVATFRAIAVISIGTAISRRVLFIEEAMPQTAEFIWACHVQKSGFGKLIVACPSNSEEGYKCLF